MTENIQSLDNYLDTDSIETQISIASKKKLLEHVATLLSGGDKALEKAIFHALVERERLGSTGIGGGVALPHGRCKDLEDARLCVITLDSAISYDAPDNKPVDVIFGLAVPDEANEQHLKMLANIANLLQQQEVYKILLSHTSSDEVISYIGQQMSET